MNRIKEVLFGKNRGIVVLAGICLVGITAVIYATAGPKGLASVASTAAIIGLALSALA